MKQNSIGKVGSLAVLALLSAGNIFFVHSGVWDAKAGAPLDLAATNAAVYQVEAASQLKDGSYIVNSKAAGFQSDVEVAVTFDLDGAMIRQVEVVAQGETDGIGSKVTDGAFLEQFAKLAVPFGLNGKSLAVVSPGTGETWGAVAPLPDPLAAVSVDHRINPDRWNPADQSMEAKAVRNLYRAGLLSSAAGKQPLTTALHDAGPERLAAYHLEMAGLTTGASAGSGIGAVYTPPRDRSPERVAAERLQRANLTANPENEFAPSRVVSPEAVAADKLGDAGLTVAVQAGAGAEPVSAVAAVSSGLNEVDAVAGATVSSTAVVQAVDQAYFYMREQVLSE